MVKCEHRARGNFEVKSTWQFFRLNTYTYGLKGKTHKCLILNEKIRIQLKKTFLKEIKKVLLIKRIIEKNWKSSETEMTTQAKIEDIMIPIFDGINYSTWKIRLMTLLEYKECKDQATRNINNSDTKVEEWKKKDLKARTILMSAVTDKQLEYIGECAYDMITKFDKIYLTKSTAM